MNQDDMPARSSTEAIVIALGFRGCRSSRDWAAQQQSLEAAYHSLSGGWFPPLLLRIGYNPEDVFAVIEPALRSIPGYEISASFWNVYSISEEIIRSGLPDDLVASVYRAKFPLAEILGGLHNALGLDQAEAVLQ